MKEDRDMSLPVLVVGNRKIIQFGGTCQTPGCTAPATHAAYHEKRDTITAHCEDHAYDVCAEGAPYRSCTRDCPNCNCTIPIDC